MSAREQDLERELALAHSSLRELISLITLACDPGTRNVMNYDDERDGDRLRSAMVHARSLVVPVERHVVHIDTIGEVRRVDMDNGRVRVGSLNGSFEFAAAEDDVRRLLPAFENHESVGVHVRIEVEAR